MTDICKICGSLTAYWSSHGWTNYCHNLVHEIKHKAWYGFAENKEAFLIVFMHDNIEYQVMLSSETDFSTITFKVDTRKCEIWVESEICIDWSIEQWIEHFKNQVILT